jgi:hypothetical protein
VGHAAEKPTGLAQDFWAERGRRAAEPRLGRKEEVGQLPGKFGPKRKLGCKNRIQIFIQGFWFKSNSFKHFQTNFELDSK